MTNMADPDRVALGHRLRLLSLGVADMKESRAAAIARMNDDGTNYDLRRALETAMAVAYARPFKANNKRRSLDRVADGPADGELQRIHIGLIAMRDQLYAHTDEEIGREVIVSAVFLFSTQREVAPEVFPQIIRLCELQEQTFAKLAVAARAELAKLPTAEE